MNGCKGVVEVGEVDEQKATKEKSGDWNETRNKE